MRRLLRRRAHSYLYLDRAPSYISAASESVGSPCYHHHAYGITSDTHAQMALKALLTYQAWIGAADGKAKPSKSLSTASTSTLDATLAKQRAATRMSSGGVRASHQRGAALLSGGILGEFCRGLEAPLTFAGLPKNFYADDAWSNADCATGRGIGRVVTRG